MRSQEGMTLVEAVLVVAIAAAAVCLAVPVVAHGRGPEGQKTRSTANLRLHGQVLALYANTHRGEVLNPYEGPTTHAGVWEIAPPWMNGALRITHDGYAYHWGPLIRQYYEDYEPIDVFAAPGDAETQQTIQDFLDFGYGDNWVVDISYWYSPTMFYSPQRFAEADGGSTAIGAVSTNLRRNELADMRFPSRKVMLLEKQDFTTPNKLLFAHPEARVGLLFGDGAVAESNNPPLYDAIDADPTLAPSGGNWADELGLATYYMDNNSSPNELLEDQQHLYPAFYMWTREGIQGRDLF